MLRTDKDLVFLPIHSFNEGILVFFVKLLQVVTYYLLGNSNYVIYILGVDVEK